MAAVGQAIRARVDSARAWGLYIAASTGAVLAIIVGGALHPTSAFYGAGHFAFRPMCHQLPERSFAFVADAPLCVCHRCFGIYAGLFVGGLIAAAGAKADPSNRRTWLIATLPMLAHVLVIQFVSAIDFSWLRVATGALFGLWGAWALSLALGQAFAHTPSHAALVPAQEERT